MNKQIIELLQQTIKKTDKRILDITSEKRLNHQTILEKNFPSLEYHYATAKSVVEDLPKLKFDIIYLDNVFQKLHWKEGKSLIKSLGNRLRFESRAIIVGPLKDREKNELLEASLKELDSLFGVRSYESINNAMKNNGFILIDDLSVSDIDEYALVYSRLKFEK